MLSLMMDIYLTSKMLGLLIYRRNFNSLKAVKLTPWLLSTNIMNDDMTV